MNTDKRNIFISYCHDDFNKVKLIVAELKNNQHFQPVVIATNREPLKPLAHKVSEGLKKSEIIIPLLTNNSIKTQWINQEIGFATALDKLIKPIVELDIMSELKGFIHKQIDLPYCYQKSTNKSKENKDFINCFRDLLSDLEDEYNLSTTQVNTEISKPTILDKAKEIAKQNEFAKMREQILKSPESIKKAENNVVEIIDSIESKVELLRNERIVLPRQALNKNPPHYYILHSESHSFAIEWHIQYNADNHTYSLKNANLVVTLCDGHIKRKVLKEEDFIPERAYDLYKYVFDINENSEFGWKMIGNNRFYSNESIAEMCLNWLLDRIKENTPA